MFLSPPPVSLKRGWHKKFPCSDYGFELWSFRPERIRIKQMGVIFFLIILVAIVAGFWFLARALKNKPGDKTESLLLLQGQINELTRTIDSKLGESSKLIQRQFGESTKIIKEITQELTKVSEGHKQVMGVTDQLKNLQDILKNPKQRGVLGEYYLEALLKNIFSPGMYQMQYPLGKDEKTGKDLIVDAVIFIGGKIVPVDSKFSLENYNRIAEEPDPNEKNRLEQIFVNDLKNRIEETAKYVKPSMGTMDFAFMFIPHEAIYYDLLIGQVGAIKANTRNLIEYAAEKHVIIVSPTSFLAYLQTVLQGLRSLQIEESAKGIRKNVELLEKHLLAYGEYLQKLGKQLGTTVNTYNAASQEFKKVDKDVMKITGEAMNVEPIELEGPEIGENE